jgi:hypothetical protein
MAVAVDTVDALPMVVMQAAADMRGADTLAQA